MIRASDYPEHIRFGFREIAPNVGAFWTGSFRGIGLHYEPQFGGSCQFGQWLYFRLDQNPKRFKDSRFYGFVYKSDCGPMIGFGLRALSLRGFVSIGA